MNLFCISRKLAKLGLLSILAFGSFHLVSKYSVSPTTASTAETHSIEAVAVEINGTKFWLPSTIHAKKGDTVKLHLVSKIPGKNNIHGFKIPAFNIEELVDEKGKSVEFVANKSGIFKIYCHLHLTHIGGQLVVLD